MVLMPIKASLKILALSLCAIVTLGGAVNEGVTQFYLAVPFAVLFLLLMKGYSRSIKLRVCGPFLLLLVVLGWKHPVNPLIYPTLGETYALSGEWHLADADLDYSGGEIITYALPSTEFSEGFNTFTRKQRSLKTDKLTLNEVKLSHPDLGTNYRPFFLTESGESVLIPDHVLAYAIKNDLIHHASLKPDVPYGLQSDWTYYASIAVMWPVIFMAIDDWL